MGGLLPRFHVSEITDPWINLSIEEYLFENARDNELHILLYRDADSVIIGRHQNPWLECPVENLAGTDIGLARRISGGGAVFHDPGNINFSFIMPKKAFVKERNLEFILSALRQIGIEGSLSKRGDIFVEGMKVSGNAQCFRRERSLHHGTLLVDSDLVTLNSALDCPDNTLQTHAVRSVRSSVANLSDFLPELTVRNIIDALYEEFVDEFGKSDIEFIRTLPEQAREYYTKNLSWEWIYGKTPSFTTSFPVSYRGEQGELDVGIEEGLIRTAAVRHRGSSIDITDLIGSMRFEMREIRKKLNDPVAKTLPGNRTGFQDVNRE